MNPPQPPAPNEQPEEPFIPLEAMTRVEHENGRWVVYLNVPTWESADEESPVTNHWKRINDYANRSEADVAAVWYQRSANRSRRPPSDF
jgi:hypothetical protein